MTLLPTLRIAVVIAFVYAISALFVLAWRARSFGTKPTYAKPVGKEGDGIRYAFIRGMLPWEKESVALHLPTFVGGLLYHAGIFVGLLYLIPLILNLTLPPAVILSARVVMLAGFVGGAALLFKRLNSPTLQLISVPDDVISNVVVDLFLAAAIASTMSSPMTPALLITAVVLFLYVPLGKIRHCVFFFYSRIRFGRLFGRRGVLPHPVREMRALHR